jgi:class 3 adenylate cyclase
MSEEGSRTDARFQELLDRWADSEPGQREGVEDVIREEFEETLAIFVLDVSGFSASVATNGILPFLARVSQMRATVVPAIEARGGEVVKFIADDVMAAFPTVDAALAAALEIRAAIDVGLGVPQEDMRFQVCIGIGYGPTLHVPSTDLWGDEVNLAFKLGEDIAGPGEILLTAKAWEALRQRPAREEPTTVRISGVEIVAHRV